MNTWFVGRHPVGHFVSGIDKYDQSPTEKTPEKKEKQIQSVFDGAGDVGEKTFFMKARIFAGQADVGGPNGSYDDFQWLAKEEIEEKVHQKYWSKVKNMLVEQ